MGAIKKRGQPDGLDPLQVEVIKAFAEGLSLPEAAARAGVPVGAIFAWAQSDHQFVQFYNLHRHLQYQAAEDRLRQLAGRATETLGALLASDDPRIRLAAELAILKAGRLESVAGPTSYNGITVGRD